MTIRWPESYRIILSRYPSVGIFDDVADPADLPALAALEARTNPRVRDELGMLALVRPADRIAGPGTTPIMAAFTHAQPSRFTDGAFGVYYAARHRETAIFEVRFHLERLYRATQEESADVDLRVYAARIGGRFDDLRAAPPDDARLDPDGYAASQAYGRGLYEANAADGVVYRSVRDAKQRACVAAFRPRAISACRTHGYLTARWDGAQQRIVAVTEREFLSGFGPAPDAAGP
ncbi:MAG TPA: RES family NAD+ phosphorylase [Candidatus Elarobacter sp.]